jgi:hypothetical protein
LDGFARMPAIVGGAVTGLSADDLAYRPGEQVNSIGWLVWHLARGEDVQLAQVSGRDQAYADGGFAGRFDLPFGPNDFGFGHGPADVARVRVTNPAILIDYYAAVHARTADFIGGLEDTDLDRIVDRNWDPPVTLGVRLVSVLGDDLQHGGQARYLRGWLDSAAG